MCARFRCAASLVLACLGWVSAAGPLVAGTTTISGKVYNPDGTLLTSKVVFIQIKNADDGLITQGQSSTATGTFTITFSYSAWPNTYMGLANKALTVTFQRQGDARPTLTLKGFQGDISGINATKIFAVVPPP